MTFASLLGVLPGTAAWFLLEAVAPALSQSLFPKIYESMSPKQRAGWNMRMTSSVHAILSCALAFTAIMAHDAPTDPEERIYKSWDAANFVLAMSTGYFVWDTHLCIAQYKTFGPEFLFHGVMCLIAYTGALTIPYIQYYGCVFLIFEASTPLVNLHWMLDKAGMAGHPLQLANGALLLLVFFLIRIIYGFYMTYFHITDGMAAWGQATSAVRPLIVGYITINSSMDLLNVYWFYGMVRSVKSRVNVNLKKRHGS